jgi:phenylalanyl-tRNA synthetase beta chain
MPTISINLRDLDQLLVHPKEGKKERRPSARRDLDTLRVEQLEPWLRLVKGEVKDHDPETGELRIELQDSNRPDLWSAEGIARQIRSKQAGGLSPYPFFGASAKRQIRVAPDLEPVRPYIAACTASGYAVTDNGLAQIIQTQEKLAEIFGRKRRTVSIGFYRLAKIVFPVSYALVKPDEAHFTPLGMEARMSLREILAVHPKGVEFGPILAGHDRVPLLRDQEGQVLSLPPVINSRDLGEVQVGDKDLLLEVTGTDLRMVMLTLNILAVNLADRGAAIEPITVTYPYETELGRTVRGPMDLGKARSIPLKTIETALGQALGSDRIRKALVSYGYDVTASKDKVSVKLPPYRNDVMHPVDVVEDVAISEGYEAFSPVMPSQFTVGGLSRIEQVSDRLRDLMIGAGFQEIISNIMASRQDLIERMRLASTEWDRLVEVDNVMSQSFACLRPSVLPSLLRVESASTRAFYPHRVFEIGEVAVPAAEEDLGSQTLVSLGACITHAAANFSEAHSVLDLMLYYMRQTYSLEPLAHPSFLEGRAGRIVLDGQGVGLIGELHPEVLESWQVGTPAVAFELQVNALPSAREG